MSPNRQATRYVIITPVRDEAKHLPMTIESVLRQTIPPAEWVIVNDGSTDDTAPIIDRASSCCAWMSIVHIANRGYRKSGGGVVDAFNEGLCALKCDDWNFLVKLDGDLSFEPDYFEKCFEKFSRDRHLGIG